MANTMGEMFKASLVKLINDKSKEHYTNDDQDFDADPVVEVTDFREDVRSSGYCDTCYHEYTVVEIDYVTASGESGTYVYGDAFADLVNDLIKL